MNTFVKVALASAAAAGVAFASWRFVRAGTPQQPDVRHPAPSTNGDLATGGGAGPAGELTKEQREQLLEELEDQLGA